MTRERLELFRKWHAEEQAEERAEPTIDWKEDAVGELIAEVDRLRSLPVIPTCGECRHLYRRGRSCEHPNATTPGEARHVDPSHEPPSWCPWRGGGR
jgi:hypothetical protein